MLVDDDSAINIISNDTKTHMRTPLLRLALVKTPFIEIEGSSVPVKGAMEILVTTSIPLKCVSLHQTFMVIDMTLAYNTILGRHLLYQINVTINTRYLTLKFLTQKGVATVRGNQVTSRQCLYILER